MTAKRTIQAAVDGAAAGDVVLVTNGVYDAGISVYNGNNRVNLNKNNLILQALSSNPGDTLIVGAPDPGTGSLGPGAVRCISLQNDGTRVIGFTLTNGYTALTGAGEAGAAVKSWNTSTTNRMVVGCVIRDCTAYNSVVEGGVYRNSQFIDNVVSNTYVANYGNFDACEFTGNSTKYYIIGNSSASRSVISNNIARSGRLNYRVGFRNCLLADNHCGTASGASQVAWLCSLANCTLVDNEIGPGSYAINASTATNSIVRFNRRVDGKEYNFDNADTTFVNSCTAPLPALGSGTITDDPKFVDGEVGDYRLAPRSPCIDTGIPVSGMVSDLLGSPRPIDGNGDGTPTFDMGCYEMPSQPMGIVICIR